MSQLKPTHAALFVLLFGLGVGVVDYALDGGFDRAGYQRVGPDGNGEVVLDVADLAPMEVWFYRYLNAGNQEVKFFVGRDSGGEIEAAFDANEICYKTGRGFRHEGDWVTCNKCDKAFRLAEVNAGGGGCKPVPVAYHLAGDRLVLREDDILAGWRFFR